MRLVLGLHHILIYPEMCSAGQQNRNGTDLRPFKNDRKTHSFFYFETELLTDVFPTTANRRQSCNHRIL